MTITTARPADPEVLLADGLDLLVRPFQEGPKPLVILLHPPKTGGTTLHFNLEASQSARNLPYMRFRIDRSQWSPPTLIVPGWTGAWDSPDITAEHMSPLMAVPDSQTLFVSGHFPFGFHERLRPFFPTRPFVYVGQVRDPIEREMSALNYEAAKTVGGISANDYIELMQPKIGGAMGLMDNPQTRLFAGAAALREPVATYDMLHRAIRNITAQFNMVATTEQTHSLMNAVVSTFDLTPVAYHKSNVTADKAMPHVTPELTGFLRDFHRLDVELHKMVRDHWEYWLDDKTGWKRSQHRADDKVVYVPMDYDANRTAYLTDILTIRAMQAAPNAQPAAFDHRLVQKKPDMRPPIP